MCVKQYSKIIILFVNKNQKIVIRHYNEVYTILTPKNWGFFKNLKKVKRKLLNYIYIY